MSTTYEVIVACHSGMTVFAFSLITNKCVTTYEEPMPNHEEVMQVGRDSEDTLKNFVSRMVLHIDRMRSDRNNLILPAEGYHHDCNLIPNWWPESVKKMEQAVLIVSCC